VGYGSARRTLVKVTVAHDGFIIQMVARGGSLQPRSITTVKPDREQPGHNDVARTLLHHEYLPATVGAQQIDLLTVYPHAKLVTAHKPFLTVP
jgi:hypothetical protein